MEGQDKDTKLWKIKEIGIFMKYVLLEPFRQIAKPRAWMYVFFILFFVMLLRGKIIEQMISFFILLALVLWTEWENGSWKKQYRKDYGKVYRSELKPK
jgi:hypothetical protein